MRLPSASPSNAPPWRRSAVMRCESKEVLNPPVSSGVTAATSTERGEHDRFYPYGKSYGQVFREQEE
jgi:hypothetical protein